jgi:hypothetical protein
MEATEYETKSRAFMERVEAIVAEVFDVEADQPIVVVGLQFGEMGRDDSALPTCVVASNLPLCAVGGAIHDMHDEVAMQHEAMHGVQDGSDGFMLTDLADAPDEVRQYAEDLAENLGIPLSAIQVREQIDTTDLSEGDLPDWLRGSDVAEAMTGGDIASAGLGLSDEDVADLNKLGASVEDEQPGKEV